jgi:polysaccharide biosynthesis transport protein
MTAPRRLRRRRTTATLPSTTTRWTRALTKIVQRHRGLIFLTVLALSGLSALVAFNLTPRYTGFATVTIDPKSTRMVNTESMLEEQTRDVRTLETQIRLLQSRSFARRVIERANLLADPEFNPALRPPEEPGPIAQNVQRLAQWLSGSVLAGTGWAMPSATPRAPVRASGDEVLEAAIGQVLGNLEVNRAGESYALLIAFTSTDPHKAAAIANQVAEQYVEEQLGTKQGAAARAAP